MLTTILSFIAFAAAAAAAAIGYFATAAINGL